MSPRRPQTSSRRGFTLIEILVISALIALLSGIAIFQVKSVMDQARIKATYADQRGVADALTNARQDLGFFPKLGFLSFSAAQLIDASNPLPEDFETLGYRTSQSIGAMRASEIWEKWTGPYFNAAGGKSPLKTTRGYYVEMELPSAPANSTLKVIDWPADPWGNPYVVYLVHLDKPGPDPANPGKFLAAPKPRWCRTPYEEPNYLAIVVSYGENGIPGGSSKPDYIPPSVVTAGKTFRLYNTTAVAGRFRAVSPAPLLASDLLTTAMLSALHMDATIPPFGYQNNSTVPGILDKGFNTTTTPPDFVPGSDDVIIAIR